MLSREDKKNQTRKALMNAALQLVEQGQNFSSISLREVAKNAGVVPTSFYRHFRDMEELGLNIVDDIGLMLRKLLRAARQNAAAQPGVVLRSMTLLVEFVCAHRGYFWFLCQVKGGGTPALRRALRNELQHFAQELAGDLRLMPAFAQVNSTDLDLAARFIVSAVFDTTIDLLDQIDSLAEARDLYIAQRVRQISFVLTGTQTLAQGPNKA